MKTNILKVQKSNRSIWETKLSISGHISDRTVAGEQSYEMVVNIYNTPALSAYDYDSTPDKTIIVDESHYETNISKYGMEALLRGIDIASLLSITGESKNTSIDHYNKEIESIAYSIVAKMEQETFFNTYDPNKLRKFIESKLASLKDKFYIEPK